jgi:hypothetical protein
MRRVSGQVPPRTQFGRTGAGCGKGLRPAARSVTGPQVARLGGDAAGAAKHLPPQHLRMQLGQKVTSHHDIDRLGVASTAD